MQTLPDMPKWQARRAPQSTTLTAGTTTTKTTVREAWRVEDERERYELFELYQQREGLTLGWDKEAILIGLMWFTSLFEIAWKRDKIQFLFNITAIIVARRQLAFYYVITVIFFLGNVSFARRWIFCKILGIPLAQLLLKNGKAYSLFWCGFGIWMFKDLNKQKDWPKCQFWK